MVVVCFKLLVQQRLRLLQTFGVKVFGELTVDIGYHVVSFLAFALSAPQVGEAHRCA
jgi:hypothetical protein